MKKLILIGGDLASGKTKFAIKLAKYFQIPFFCKDYIKETLCDTFKYKDRQENLILSQVSIKIMYDVFTQFALAQKPLILESNFHQEELEQLKELATIYNYEVLYINLFADITTLHHRFMNRIEKEGRHPAHLAVDFTAINDFQQYIEKSRTQNIFLNYMQVDASDFAYQEDQKIKATIWSFLNTCLETSKCNQTTPS